MFWGFSSRQDLETLDPETVPQSTLPSLKPSTDLLAGRVAQSSCLFTQLIT